MTADEKNNPFVPKPAWLKVQNADSADSKEVIALLGSLELHTVCEEANCPNRGECFGRKTATFMILGKNCTRNCGFCCVGKGVLTEPDAMEPFHIAQAVSMLDLRYAVITSVTRDDLADGGASHFADVIRAIRAESPGTVIEVLIPDFKGDEDALHQVVYAMPNVIGHNIETVRRLYPQVRKEAEYDRSLELLGRVKTALPRMLTKSGIMLGLGETKEEVLETFADLRRYGCNLLTIGQYLAPSRAHLPVAEYVPPEQFDWYKERALEQGFDYVASGPLVRSSYQAEQGWDRANRRWTSGYGES